MPAVLDFVFFAIQKYYTIYAYIQRVPVCARVFQRSSTCRRCCTTCGATISTGRIWRRRERSASTTYGKCRRSYRRYRSRAPTTEERTPPRIRLPITQLTVRDKQKREIQTRRLAVGTIRSPPPPRIIDSRPGTVVARKPASGVAALKRDIVPVVPVVYYNIVLRVRNV